MLNFEILIVFLKKKNLLCSSYIHTKNYIQNIPQFEGPET